MNLEGTPAELLKTRFVGELCGVLHNFHSNLVAVSTTSELLHELKDATIEVLPQSEDRSECGNHRGVSPVIWAGQPPLKLLDERPGGLAKRPRMSSKNNADCGVNDRRPPT